MSAVIVLPVSFRKCKAGTISLELTVETSWQTYESIIFSKLKVFGDSCFVINRLQIHIGRVDYLGFLYARFAVDLDANMSA